MSDKGWFPWEIVVQGWQTPPTTHDTANTYEHLPITTRRGRVIYDRKPHPWTEKDVIRVTSRYFGLAKPTNSPLWIELLERITIWMMDKILSLWVSDAKADILADQLYYIFRNALARILDKMIKTPNKQVLQEFLSESGAK